PARAIVSYTDDQFAPKTPQTDFEMDLVETDGSGAAARYIGDAGRRYHERRANLNSERVQRERAAMFEGFTRADDTLLDFGCGSGGVAAALPAKFRIGVEISELAISQARQKLSSVVSSLAHVPSEHVDACISYHAIEHVQNPVAIFH